ncbi:MAG: extracellular solute-binding protein [Pseudomonadota bacterium]
MERRLLLQSLAAGASAALVSPWVFAQDRYTRYRGQTVRISIPMHPHFDAMQKLLPAFTRETGIKVQVEQLPMAEMKKKQLLEMAKPQCDFDLVAYVVMWKGEYVRKQFVSDLAPFFDDAKLADPQFDMADIVPGYRENIGLVGGWKGYLAGPDAKLYGLPYGAETSVLAYRKDIFEKHKLTPPASYIELERLLPVLREKTGEGALTSRGKAGHQCVHAWLLHLNPLNGKIFENNWTTRLNDRAGVRALKILKTIVDTGPAGSAEFGQVEMMDAFLQGRSAMYLDSTVIFGAVRDPAKSKIGGKVGYARHPGGGKHSAQSGGLGLAIPKTAQNANAGFLLMQWLTAKEQDKAVSRLGGSPQRLSTLADAGLLRQFPEFEVLRYFIRDADPDWRPIIPEWDEINTEVLGIAVHNALTGKTTSEFALNEAAQKVTAIMQRGNYLR